MISEDWRAESESNVSSDLMTKAGNRFKFDQGPVANRGQSRVFRDGWPNRAPSLIPLLGIGHIAAAVIGLQRDAVSIV